ncbi:MAG: hypothetical protein JSR54_11935 [Proteobacteria bacterium]|nr:hypothetical protein [Pseudomonadota bacterium]
MTAARAGWLDGLRGEWLRVWRHRATARAVSRESMRIYHEVVAARPELAGVLRYQEVVARQAGVDEREARAIVDRAEDSFASWPVGRAVTFRDVVQYLVVRRCLDGEPGGAGIRSRLVAIIADEVPGDL